MCVCDAVPHPPPELHGRVLVLQHPHEEKCAICTLERGLQQYVHTKPTWRNIAALLRRVSSSAPPLLSAGTGCDWGP